MYNYMTWHLMGIAILFEKTWRREKSVPILLRYGNWRPGYGRGLAVDRLEVYGGNLCLTVPSIGKHVSILDFRQKFIQRNYPGRWTVPSSAICMCALTNTQHSVLNWLFLTFFMFLVEALAQDSHWIAVGASSAPEGVAATAAVPGTCRAVRAAPALAVAAVPVAVFETLAPLSHCLCSVTMEKTLLVHSRI